MFAVDLVDNDDSDEGTDALGLNLEAQREAMLEQLRNVTWTKKR